jgi:hypothetical protein
MNSRTLDVQTADTVLAQLAEATELASFLEDHADKSVHDGGSSWLGVSILARQIAQLCAAARDTMSTDGKGGAR